MPVRRTTSASARSISPAKVASRRVLPRPEFPRRPQSGRRDPASRAIRSAATQGPRRGRRTHSHRPPAWDDRPRARRRRVEFRVLSQDGGVHRAQGRPRFDAQLLREHLSRAREARERIGSTPWPGTARISSSHDRSRVGWSASTFSNSGNRATSSPRARSTSARSSTATSRCSSNRMASGATRSQSRTLGVKAGPRHSASASLTNARAEAQSRLVAAPRARASSATNATASMLSSGAWRQ